MAGASTGTRKHGRKKDRSDAQKRYTIEERWNKNKRRKAQTHANKTHQSVRIKVNEKWETVQPNNI